MVRLYFPVLLKNKMKKKEYPRKIGLGEYDGDDGVDGELFGCRFHGVLAGHGTTNRWYFDEIGFWVECEEIGKLIETARVIEKFLTEKGLEFGVPYYELEIKIPVTLPVHVSVNDNSWEYEIIGDNIHIKYEKLEDFDAIKK